MTETLPDFDLPTTVPEAPAPKKPRKKPTKRRSATRRTPSVAKPARVVKRRKMKRPGMDRRTKAFRAQRTAAPADNSPSALDVALNIYSRITALLTVLAAQERKVLLERLLKET